MRQNDKYKILSMDINKIIQQFYGMYYMKGWMLMTMKEILSLRVGDKVDHRDKFGRFLYATIKEKYGDRQLKVHYDNFDNQWDEWTDFEDEYYRFAKAGSISRRPIHDYNFQNIKVGDYVDFNPGLQHPGIGWKSVEVLKFDNKSGQVLVVYQGPDDQNHEFWTHLDNREEVASFKTKAG